MQKTIKRKPLIFATAIVLSLVTIIGATFAWFTASDSVKNRLATKDALANVHIQETFVPPDDWKPNQTITKEVAVIDSGSAPALVRVTFAEELTINLPAVGEIDAFTAAKETAKQKPLLFDATAYPHAPGDDWVKLTDSPNAAIGGISLAATYPIEVYAKYVPKSTPTPPGGSVDSYAFIAWSPISISGSDFDGKLQAVDFVQTWNNVTKVLTLSDIKYMTYQGEKTTTADWKTDKPAACNRSVAEAKMEALGAAPAGSYPGHIELNYDKVNAAITTDEWYYNPADGYFYYIGLVEPGVPTATMLKSLLLNENADAYYSNMTYDLIVNMEAIQHTKDAVDAEWAIADTALKTAIHALCES